MRGRLSRKLEKMGQDAAETDALVGTLDGRKTAIREKAAETTSEAKEMMRT